LIEAAVYHEVGLREAQRAQAREEKEGPEEHLACVRVCDKENWLMTLASFDVGRDPHGDVGVVNHLVIITGRRDFFFLYPPGNHNNGNDQPPC
jgi:hypothetical protein